MKSRAANISAAHCGMPCRKSSFFASTMARTGAWISSCVGESEKRKSQKPVRPRAGSTANSVPEKRLTSRFRWRRASNRIGVTIISDRDFAVEMSNPTGALSSRYHASRASMATGGTFAKRSRGSTTRSPSFWIRSVIEK